MDEFPDLLDGPLNIYNVTLAAVIVASIVAVVRESIGAVHGTQTRPRGWRRVPFVAGIVLLGVGALSFAAASTITRNEDIPSWGLWWYLPAALLATLAVLAGLRPDRAGRLLARAAIVLPVLLLALGLIGIWIDPAWGEIMGGPVAVGIMMFSIPAAVTAAVLVAGSRREAGETRAPSSPAAA